MSRRLLCEVLVVVVVLLLLLVVVVVLVPPHPEPLAETPPVLQPLRVSCIRNTLLRGTEGKLIWTRCRGGGRLAG